MEFIKLSNYESADILALVGTIASANTNLRTSIAGNRFFSLSEYNSGHFY